MERIWEIDFFRGLAVIFMLAFNYSFALSFLGLLSFESWIFWFAFPRVVAGMFIFISGLSLALSLSRSKKISFRKYAKRAAAIFSLGLLATAATWLVFSQETIIFGILHFLGVSVLIGFLLRKFKSGLLAIGIAAIAAGIALSYLTANFPWLLWLGLAPQNFSTFDYFPLLPWIGVFLIGMYFGKTLYANGKRRYRVMQQPALSKVLCFLGRHSLAIYVIHQPILIAALSGLGIVHIF